MTDPSELSDKRYAQQRATMLARRTDLRKTAAEAVAWGELGYSRGGIAAQMDTGESTVKSYHERAMALYGFEILEFLTTDGSELPEYDRVEPGYHQRRHPDDQQRWVDLVDRLREGLPQEWVDDVLKAAKEDGVTPNP